MVITFFDNKNLMVEVKLGKFSVFLCKAVADFKDPTKQNT